MDDSGVVNFIVLHISSGGGDGLVMTVIKVIISDSIT